jgi:hypothetical protein
MLGLIFLAVLGRGLGDAVASLIGLAPTLVGGVLLLFLAKPIAVLITRGLE